MDGEHFYISINNPIMQLQCIIHNPGTLQRIPILLSTLCPGSASEGTGRSEHLDGLSSLHPTTQQASPNSWHNLPLLNPGFHFLVVLFSPLTPAAWLRLGHSFHQGLGPFCRNPFTPAGKH